VHREAGAAVRVLTSKNIGKTIGQDSQGVRHVLQPKKLEGNNNDYTVTSRCGIHQWDTLDFIEGTPNCVRCMCGLAL
jgi:hypothetical protein